MEAMELMEVSVVMVVQTLWALPLLFLWHRWRSLCDLFVLCLGVCDEPTGRGPVLCARRRRRQRFGPATAAGSRSGGYGSGWIRMEK